MGDIKFVQKTILYEPTIYSEKSYYSNHNLLNNHFLVYRKELNVEDGLLVLGITKKISDKNKEKTHDFTHVAFEFEIGDKVQLEDNSEYKIIDKSRSPYGHVTYYLENKYEDVENYNELSEKCKEEIDQLIEEIENRKFQEPKLDFFGKVDTLFRSIFKLKT